MSSKPRERYGITALAVGLLAVAVALGLAAPANANTTRVNDPVGDVINPGERPVDDYDIRFTEARSISNRLVFVVRLVGEARVSDDHMIPGSGITVEIATSHARSGDCHGQGRDPLGRADYVLTSHGNPRMVDCHASGIPDFIPVGVQRRTNALVFVINKSAIGNPTRIGWFASTGPATTTSDLAPDPDARGNPVFAPHQARDPAARTRWRQCGDLTRAGAGAFNVIALRVGCPLARKVANRYTWHGGDMGQSGWRCASRQTGLESSLARCLKPSHAGWRVVRFEIGA